MAGRVDSFMEMSEKPKSEYTCRVSLMKSAASCFTWSSVQKMWASSWVKPRTRMMPCSAPDGSLRWQAPNSARRSGRSR
ncbi:hypothetical protein D9M69_484330 [compost metagenome]